MRVFFFFRRFSRNKQNRCSVSYHIITSSYSISASCCPTVWRRRLINKREYSYPTNGTRAAPCRTASRLNGAKKKRKNEGKGKKRENADAVTEARRDKSDDPTARATRPGISAEFSRVLLSAPNPLASPSSPPASASRRIYAFIRAGPRDRIRE